MQELWGTALEGLVDIKWQGETLFDAFYDRFLECCRHKEQVS